MRAEPLIAATAPRERGLLMTGPNVLKILAEPIRKTQTRRLTHFDPVKTSRIYWTVDAEMVGGSKRLRRRGRSGRYTGWVRECDAPFLLPVRCPHGMVGDRLWVREAWRPVGQYAELTTPELSREQARSEIAFREQAIVYRADGDDQVDRWRPSLHMPRWASRLTLEITEVRVERLLEISAEDVLAEGALSTDEFARSWIALHGLGAWDANPWVWAISFRRLAGQGGGRG